MLDDLIERVVLGILAICTIYITGRSVQHMEKAERVIEKQSQYIDTLLPPPSPKPKERKVSGEKVVYLPKRK